METMRAGNKGYVADVAVVTYNNVKGNIKDKDKSRIFLSFGQHGRELITSEVALHLLSVLAGEETVVGMDPTNISSMLNNLVIKVVPVENLNGRKLVEAGDLCDRRNGRGVDLNRNWSVDWGIKEKDYDPYEENPGSAPFSEPEAQIMRKLSKLFNPHIWVNVHSGMEIYGDLLASSKDCFKMFNPVDEVAFQGVISSWTAAFLMVFHTAPSRLEQVSKSVPAEMERWVSSYGSPKGRNKEGGKLEGIELGMQELRTYFRLFMQSSVLLMFMFCSRILKNKYKQTPGI